MIEYRFKPVELPPMPRPENSPDWMRFVGRVISTPIARDGHITHRYTLLGVEEAKRLARTKRAIDAKLRD